MKLSIVKREVIQIEWAAGAAQGHRFSSTVKALSRYCKRLPETKMLPLTSDANGYFEVYFQIPREVGTTYRLGQIILIPHIQRHGSP
jgi:hypothetical protein